MVVRRSASLAFITFVLLFPAARSRADLGDGLVVHIPFDDDAFPGTSFGVDALPQATCQSALDLGDPTTYDQCPAVDVGPDGSRAARFAGTLCDMNSDYLGVATAPSFASLPRGTIALWVKYQPGAFNNARLVDTYKAMMPDTWLFGRDGTPYHLFKAVGDDGLTRHVLYFPDQDGGGEQWSHLSVTWDGTTIRGYYDGEPFGAPSVVSQADFSSFRIGTYLAISALNHGDLRNSPDFNCPNQYGAPRELHYVQPNAGFLNGTLDDIRLYDRALSADEVRMLVGGRGRGRKVLSVELAGDGLGSVTSPPGGVSCGRFCAAVFAPDRRIVLTATPTIDSAFAGWEGGCSGLEPTCTVTMRDHVAVRATFRRTGVVVASLDASDFELTAPMRRFGTAIAQPGHNTTDPSTSGRAQATFDAPVAGQYVLSATANASDTGENSFFVTIDSPPVDATTAWHFSVNRGFRTVLVSAQGAGDSDRPEFVPKVFDLAAGPHVLYFYGRESYAALRRVEVVRLVRCMAPSDCASPPACSVADGATCVDGRCVYVPSADGATCSDDGNACTRDVCAAGVCAHEATAACGPDAGSGGNSDAGAPVDRDAGAWHDAAAADAQVNDGFDAGEGRAGTTLNGGCSCSVQAKPRDRRSASLAGWGAMMSALVLAARARARRRRKSPR